MQRKWWFITKAFVVIVIIMCTIVYIIILYYYLYLWICKRERERERNKKIYPYGIFYWTTKQKNKIFWSILYPNHEGELEGRTRGGIGEKGWGKRQRGRLEREKRGKRWERRRETEEKGREKREERREKEDRDTPGLYPQPYVYISKHCCCQTLRSFTQSFLGTLSNSVCFYNLLEILFWCRVRVRLGLTIQGLRLMPLAVDTICMLMPLNLRNKATRRG